MEEREIQPWSLVFSSLEEPRFDQIEDFLSNFFSQKRRLNLVVIQNLVLLWLFTFIIVMSLMVIDQAIAEFPWF